MKRIIIVGASSGIGKEMALMYAQQGHLVGITGRRKELLEQIQQQFPQQILIASFDVMNDENRTHIQRLAEQLGGLDLLIYNSGFGDISENLNYEIEIKTTRTNVNGFVSIVSFAFNYFVQQGYGQIALTSSIAALRGNSWAPAYSASKAFMSNYAEGLSIKAKKLKKDITITDLKPGFVKTKMAKGNGQFWVAEPVKAAQQIVTAIENKKRIAYITKRWWFVAQIMRRLPYSIYSRIA
ncbi:MAG: oxidoreductase [Chitinophagaceae bacterium]